MQWVKVNLGMQGNLPHVDAMPIGRHALRLICACLCLHSPFPIFLALASLWGCIIEDTFGPPRTNIRTWSNRGHHEIWLLLWQSSCHSLCLLWIQVVKRYKGSKRYLYFQISRQLSDMTLWRTFLSTWQKHMQKRVTDSIGGHILIWCHSIGRSSVSSRKPPAYLRLTVRSSRWVASQLIKCWQQPMVMPPFLCSSDDWKKANMKLKFFGSSILKPIYNIVKFTGFIQKFAKDEGNDLYSGFKIPSCLLHQFVMFMPVYMQVQRLVQLSLWLLKHQFQQALSGPSYT